MNAVSPTTEPTDRSTLRVMITSVWPTARIAKIDALSARLRSDAVSMKRGSRMRGDRDQQRERDDDAELADAEDALDEPAGALALERVRWPRVMPRPPRRGRSRAG